MPRTNIAKQTEASAATFPWSATGLILTEVAADVANGNETVACGRLLLIARNSGGSSRTVTIDSAADAKGRTGDVAAETLAAGEIRMFLLVRDGWQQEDSGTLKYWFEANHADVKFSLIELIA